MSATEWVIAGILFCIIILIMFSPRTRDGAEDFFEDLFILWFCCGDDD